VAYFVIQTEANREATAAHFLLQEGYAPYLPKIRTKGRITALFPSYLFVSATDFWYPIKSTVAVIGLLMSGDHPAKLKDEIVNAIKMKERNGVVKLPEPKRIKRGDKIRIIRGSFDGHLAIFDGMSGNDRSRVLLDLLGRKVVVEIPKRDLQQLV
jgi:transcriptional antiterminator RfaH